MKKILRMTIGAVCMAGLLVVPFQASAIALTIGDAYYLGELEKSAPASESAEAGYINNLITLAAGQSNTTISGKKYDRVDSDVAGPFPTATATGAKKEDTDQTNINATGFAYILGKYGQNSYVWFLSGALTDIVLPAKLSGKGLSHSTLFNPGISPIPPPSVPDGGTTLLLLGAVMAGFAVLRRKLA